MRVLGIDTSLRSTGIGVVESRASRFVAVEWGTIKNKANEMHSSCLRNIQDDIRRIIERCRPQVAAIEGAFFFKNAHTAMILGEARGVVIATCAAAGLPVFEYSPRAVKQGLTGYGAAQKGAVAKMMMRILGLPDCPREDAADALAIAICHLNNQSGIAALRPKPI